MRRTAFSFSFHYTVKPQVHISSLNRTSAVPPRHSLFLLLIHLQPTLPSLPPFAATHFMWVSAAPGRKPHTIQPAKLGIDCVWLMVAINLEAKREKHIVFIHSFEVCLFPLSKKKNKGFSAPGFIIFYGTLLLCCPAIVTLRQTVHNAARNGWCWLMVKLASFT